MRFTELGPSIPTGLLTSRDRGEVVFFCGAGVSKPAGLLSFFELTVQVMKKLGVPAASKVATQMAAAIAGNDPELAPPFDQVFGQLQRLYSVEKIEAEVTRLLRTPKNVRAVNHETVLRLSKDERGRPFVVTTNFDLLFERAMPGLRYWSPPILPLMTGDSSHDGVVYLHGRLGSGRHREGTASSLILGSGDFGRAYLADGWATNFFRQLLERKTVVLLGYSAGDPPIRYLLEGLAGSTSARLQPIYAFDRGEESDVVSKWRELGVIGVPFGAFEDLWASLDEWAVRADDPSAWNVRVARMAEQSPRSLRPFERGQVATLAAAPDGALAFSNSDPPPNAEWLCVLDRNTRHRPSFSASVGNGRVDVNPLQDYGLDDDTPQVGSRLRYGVDLLARLPSDTDVGGDIRLSGTYANRSHALPRRLLFLSSWFEKVCHEPVAIWWASRQLGLHTELTSRINRRMSGYGAAFSEGVQRAWSLLLEMEDDLGEDFHDLRWYDFANKLRRTGWTRGAFRAFESTIRPRLKLSPVAEVFPPGSPDVHIEALLRFQVHCTSRHGQDIDIPDAALAQVLMIVCRSLERAGDLLAETGISAEFFRLPTLEPEEKPGRRFVPQDGPEYLFLWAVGLFDRLSRSDKPAALRQVALLPPSAPFFFDKFRLHAWASPGLFEPAVIATGLIELSDASFWNVYLERDVLHLLRLRWQELSDTQRRSVEERICNPVGRARSADHEGSEEFRRYQIGSRLGWLERNHCELSDAAAAALASIRASEGWSERSEVVADLDHEGRSGWVERRTDPSSLDGLPLTEIIPAAASLSGRQGSMFVEHAPFEGLVAERPARALAALASESRAGRYPQEFWQQLFSKWPKNTTPCATALCGRRILRLPAELKVNVRGYLTSWISEHMVGIAKIYPETFEGVWDDAFDTLQAAGEEATKSGLGGSFVAGKEIHSSRRSLDHAINGPVGKLVDTLLDAIGESQPGRNDKIAGPLAARLTRSLGSIGEGADHAAGLMGRHLEWLNFVDPDWVRRELLPLFDLENVLAEAAWRGFLHSGSPPQSKDLFRQLKQSFLGIFSQRLDWLSEDRDERNAVTVLVIAAWWHRKGREYISDEECRAALQSVDDEGRQTAIWTASRIIGEHDAWTSFGRRFFTAVWPQEVRFQTSGTSDALLRLADDSFEKFPEMIKTLKDFLRPTEHPDMYLFRQRRGADAGERASLAKRWPKAVLEVADRVIDLDPPYVPSELGALLADIGEAEPALRTTSAWRRLTAIVNGQRQLARQ
ncbi:SIR2 family protein [Rhizobium jaguaris]|uniref:Uncharacterized protein n=1 Tax=Rhizobium jaguaris TaxID=1312183 RepID=A0A387G926_9HYPH|nr:SIR2 family protein [Rhizobium jaguaris]AYG64332.1 hypothetical protein CCGE525_36885 [Rhizobium jaguaris]